MTFDVRAARYLQNLDYELICNFVIFFNPIKVIIYTFIKDESETILPKYLEENPNRYGKRNLYDIPLVV